MKSIIKKIHSPATLIGMSLVLGLFIVYPNTAAIFNYMDVWVEDNTVWQKVGLWVFRLFIFATLFACLLLMNTRQSMYSKKISLRLLRSIAVTALFYGIYVLVSLLIDIRADCFEGLLMFQFIVACLISTTAGHFYMLYEKQDKIEKEMNQLKLENLQSRCDALASQINPHFLFNSLNGLTSLIRCDNKTDALEYISNMSGVFRYILQSERQNVVTLAEELVFLDSFAYMQQIRYADKLYFEMDIPPVKKNMRLPALSLLPLIENVVKHNVIDSENPMTIRISVTGDNMLLVSNLICEKIDKPEESGIGLKNLINRFELLSGAKVKVEIDNNYFQVYLPLLQVA